MYRLMFSSVLALAVSHSALAMKPGGDGDGDGKENPPIVSKQVSEQTFDKNIQAQMLEEGLAPTASSSSSVVSQNNTLPKEVLALIFYHAARSNTFDPYTLSLVCSRWREVIRDKFVLARIARIRGHIDFDLTKYMSSEVGQVLSELQSQRQCLSSLRIKGATYESAALCTLPGKIFPCHFMGQTGLTSLVISGDVDMSIDPFVDGLGSATDDVTQVPSFSVIQNLEKVDIQSVSGAGRNEARFVSYVLPRLPKLKSVAIGVTKSETIPYFLRDITAAPELGMVTVYINERQRHFPCDPFTVASFKFIKNGSAWVSCEDNPNEGCFPRGSKVLEASEMNRWMLEMLALEPVFDD